MVQINTVLESVALGITQQVPDSFSFSEVTFATLELDFNGQHSAVNPPVVEIRPVDYARNQRHNTDFIGYEHNDAGEQIGRIYQANFEMPIAISVLVASQSSHDDREIMSQIRTALWYYDSSMMSNPLPSPSGTGTLSEITELTVGQAEPQNDLSLSPGLRRTQQLVDTRFVERVSTVDYGGPDTPIRSVETADAGDASDPDAPSGTDRSSVDIVLNA